MDEIGKILPAVFKKQIRQSEPRLMEILEPLWLRIAGKGIADHSQPAMFASGVLTLHADSAMWSTQLRHLSEELRAAINSFLGQPIVKKLRIRTVAPSSLFAPSRLRNGPATSGPLKLDLTLDTAVIADPEVASALATSYSKYFHRPGRS